MLRKAGVSVGAAAAAWTTVQRAHASERVVPPPREVGVVSYNVLSPALGGAKHYYTCKEEDMDADTRFARVVAKIERQIEDGHGVICLQEVSQSWSGPLHTYFANRGFHFVFASYGSAFSNYMGNAIVYDTARYEAEKIEIQRVSDTYRGWLKVPRVQLSFLTKLYRLVFGNPPREFCPWNEAENRKNQLVLAKLRGREHGETFCVSNYHMPCLFGSAEKVQVMNIHAQLVSEKTHAFAAGSPFLMVGDWNFQPGTSPYQLITEGAIGEDDPERPVHPKGKWESKVPALRSGMLSAPQRHPRVHITHNT